MRHAALLPAAVLAAAPAQPVAAHALGGLAPAPRQRSAHTSVVDLPAPGLTLFALEHEPRTLRQRVVAANSNDYLRAPTGGAKETRS